MNNKFKITVGLDNTINLEVLEDIKKGETINLSDIVNQNKDQEAFLNFSIDLKNSLESKYKETLKKELRESIENELKVQHNNLIKSKDDEIKDLEHEKNKLIENKQLEIDKEVSKKQEEFSVQLAKKDEEIKNLSQLNKEQIAKTIAQKDNEYKDKINELEKSNSNLQKDFDNLKENQELLTNDKISKALAEKIEQIKKLETEKQQLQGKYDELSRSKKMMNIKQLGNELEDWCKTELNNQLINNLSDTFIDRAEIISGTAADFIVEVEDPSQQVFKIVLEMKTEQLDSVNKKTNMEHTQKLVKDAIKNKGNVAILVTELEKDDIFMFKRIHNDDIDVYWTRPDGLVFLVSILRMMFLKYASLKQLDLNFKTKKQILDDFNDFKDSIMNNSLKNIESNLNKIQKANDDIQKQVDTIKDSINVILESHFQALRNKIDQFKIENKILKKIEE